MRLTLPPSAQAAVAAALLTTLSVSPALPALAIADDAPTKSDFKIQGGGASTLQSGRRITITRGVNLDNTDWEGEDLKGVAFQQSVVRSANFKKANLFTASFFDADLSNSNFQDANMQQTNLEMADLSGADLTNVDLTNAYLTGAVLNGPKGSIKSIENTDWTDAECARARRLRQQHVPSARASAHVWAPRASPQVAQGPAHVPLQHRQGRESEDGRGDEDHAPVQGLRPTRERDDA